MRLSREQIARAVTLDYVSIDQIRKRDILNEPIAGIKVDVPTGEILLQDIREDATGPEAVGIVFNTQAHREAGLGASGPEIERCASALAIVAQEGGSVRADLHAGGTFAAWRIPGGELSIGIIGPDDEEAVLTIDDMDARRVVGALLTILEYYRAQREVSPHGR